MGIHTGEAVAVGDDYAGLSLHQVARIMSAGHGGQVLVSHTTQQLAAAALPDAALELYRQLDEPFGIGWAGHMLGSMLTYEGQLEEAAALLREALEVFARSGDRGGILLLLLDLSVLAGKAGEDQRYWRLSGAVDRIRKTTGIGVADIGFEFLGW
ncbi:MAG: hypothetical protein M3N29_08510 [Chloroflexota bacterium]|nr:hypothetical protein [Chloroflexota bacterium]